MHVAVRTPEGDHDIDQLSSGEKELFYTLVTLIRIRSLPSVILYDEPERHLNAGLEALIIPALEKIHTRNQLWLATHALELIDSVPLNDLVAFRRDVDGRVTSEKVRERPIADRIRIFRSLGATVGVQVAARQVVFVEGEDSFKDQRILDKLARPRVPGVLFVASGASGSVMGAATRASLLIEQASTDARFSMILDRDYRDTATVEVLSKRLNNRVFIWGCHEIENLLLEPAVLLEVLRSNGIETMTSASDVDHLLRDCARNLQELFVHQWAAFDLSAHRYSDVEPSIARPRDSVTFAKWVESERKHRIQAFSEETVAKAIENSTQSVQRCLGTTGWRTLLPGKETLSAFRVATLPSLPEDLFIEQILHVIGTSGALPSEISRLCRFIEGSR